MTIMGRLEIERSERVDMAVPATLRDEGHAPNDVEIRNLSSTGCMVGTSLDLPTGTVVWLGIPGLGMSAGSVVRSTLVGCAIAFFQPLTAGQITSVRMAETVAEGNFVQFRRPASRDKPGTDASLFHRIAQVWRKWTRIDE